MSLQALRRSSLCFAVLLGALLASGSSPDSSKAFSVCAPVVVKAGGFYSAKVTVLSGRTDCEKARRQIYAAISSSRYSDREINGWTCSSTSRSGSGPFGAKCAKEPASSREPREVIQSAQPRPCGSCHSIRN
jgi:hypothetical protein